MKEEVISEIPDFPGYGANCEGEVFNLKTGKRLTPFLHGDRKKKNGLYPSVALRKNNRSYTRKLSFAVLTAFVGPRPEGKVAAHLDGNKNNNKLSNLAWASYSENEAHKRLHGSCLLGEKANAAKLTEKQVKEIRAIGRSKIAKVVAKEYGVSPTCIREILRRKNWRHL